MRRPLILIVAAVGFVLVIGAVVVGIQTFRRTTSVPFVSDSCRALSNGQSVRLEPEQAGYVATITASRVRNGLPRRAAAVALATALQESKLRNLPGGDRDSVGLFQQRPSQGWGSVEDLMDPRYASDAFYRRLKKIEGWESMRVTDAAQAVQRSAGPEAYQQWEPDALIMSEAFDGAGANGSVTCILRSKSASPAATATATSTDDLLSTLRGDLGRSYARTTGETSASGFTLRVPTDSSNPTQAGWRTSYWLVAKAREYGIRTVSYAGLRWSADGGSWQKATDPPPSRRVVVETGTGGGDK